MGRLNDKIAIITGATSGIGEAIAMMYANEGAKIVATGRNETKGNALIEQITTQGGDAVFVKCDVRKTTEIPLVRESAMNAYGRIDILVNSAGVCFLKPFLEQDLNDLNLIFETNFRSYVLLMQEMIPIMSDQGRGTIVNIASISAIWPEVNSYFYGAMKAGITNLSRNVAKEFSRKGIRINSILPGPINTNMTPDIIKNNAAARQKLIDEVGMLGRLGEPEDVAYAAVYLGSDESSFVTGIDLVVDGGVCISN